MSVTLLSNINNIIEEENKLKYTENNIDSLINNENGKNGSLYITEE